jgi:hypothetical protein
MLGEVIWIEDGGGETAQPIGSSAALACEVRGAERPRCPDCTQLRTGCESSPQGMFGKFQQEELPPISSNLRQIASGYVMRRQSVAGFHIPVTPFSVLKSARRDLHCPRSPGDTWPTPIVVVKGRFVL